MRFLQFHEVVNDIVGGVVDDADGATDAPEENASDASGTHPIVVTWCPL
ncbi:hypothetical protein BN903_3 [Halorubrum sp. AJ67]|nr:hypothetical protein BN903_3 [Halorubrum sp. AJ67]